MIYLWICSHRPRKISKISLGTAGKSIKKELSELSELSPSSIFSRYRDNRTFSHLAYEDPAV